MSGSADTENDINGFVPEKFCDAVYDYVDEYLADAMDGMETQLQRAATEGQHGQEMVTLIKKCCDNVQKRMQEEFDRNLDIFEWYVKKNVSMVAESLRGQGSSSSRAMARETGTGGILTREHGDTTGTLQEDGNLAVDAANDGNVQAESTGEYFSADNEAALDAELLQLRQRRRKALRRRVSAARKRARTTDLLQAAREFVEALRQGVSSSFNVNGLTPLPAKVKQAVQSSTELQALATRAQDLTQRLDDADPGGTSSEGGGRGAATQPISLRKGFERSRDQVLTEDPLP